MRAIEKENFKIIEQLLSKILLGINSMLEDYPECYKKEEIALLIDAHKQIKEQIEKIQSNTYKKEQIEESLAYEKNLKPLAFRCWNVEVEKGAKYISWFKGSQLADTPEIISATFSKNTIDRFCDARYGISYEVTMDGFLGACNKDAATLVEDPSKISLYTVGLTSSNRVVNSYNLATPIITPIQAFDKSTNNYRSKHNEVILDSRYIRPIAVTYISDNDLEMVEQIRKVYGIARIVKEEYKEKRYTRY